MNSHNNHFHPKYREKNEIVNNAPIDLLDNSYKLINEYAKKNNIKIFNISKTTFCDEFKRMKVSEIKNVKKMKVSRIKNVK